MKIAVYGVNAEIIALARAHDLTPIGVERLVETLTPLFTWEDAPGEMLARMIVAAEPPGTTHYARSVFCSKQRQVPQVAAIRPTFCSRGKRFGRPLMLLLFKNSLFHAATFTFVFS